MVVQGEILAVVSALYEAALGQQAWPDVLARVALLLGDPREAALPGILEPHLRRALQVERRQAAVAAGHRPGLSRRERDCLARISRGASSKTVARQLDLSSHTVDQHIRSAMAKLGASTRTGAVIMALERGLLPAPAPDEAARWSI